MGVRKRPPAPSCQPAKAIGLTPAGRPQRLVSVTPSAIVAAPTRPATIPTRSSAASGPITTRPTPNTPVAPQTARQTESRSCRTAVAMTATMSGCTAPRVAATPPGSRSAATKSSGKKSPIFSTPSAPALPHQAPLGSVRVTASATRPAGNARRSPANSGWLGGRSSVVTT